MDELINLAVKLIAMIIMALIAIALQKFRSYASAKAAESDSALLKSLIDGFAEAAEQLLKKEDPDGSKRLAYVESQLKAAGYVINSIVKSKIESSVFRINLLKKIE